ncbi:MAG: hypothetical protein V4724_04000 [Pseudomonadota bacterium]
MNIIDQTIQLSNFRNFVIEATAIKVGLGWRPQFRLSRDDRKVTTWRMPVASGYEDSTLAIAAATQHAIRDIKLGRGSCFA